VRHGTVGSGAPDVGAGGERDRPHLPGADRDDGARRGRTRPPRQRAARGVERRRHHARRPARDPALPRGDRPREGVLAAARSTADARDPSRPSANGGMRRGVSPAIRTRSGAPVA